MAERGRLALLRQQRARHAVPLLVKRRCLRLRSKPKASHLVRHGEGCAVGALDERVGFVVADEPLSLGIEVERALEADGFDYIRLRDDAVEAIVRDDDTKRRYIYLAAQVDKLFKGILPDPLANSTSSEPPLPDAARPPSGHRNL